MLAGFGLTRKKLAERIKFTHRQVGYMLNAGSVSPNKSAGRRSVLKPE